MPNIKPFKGFLPQKGRELEIAVRPPESIGSGVTAGADARFSNSFLNVISPPNEGLSTEGVHQLARNHFLRLADQGLIKQEEEKVLFVYKITVEDESHTCVWACTAFEDYVQNKLKKHEHTRAERERGLMKYFINTGVDANPVIVTYPKSEKVEQIINRVMKVDPDFKFYEKEENANHHIWVVRDKNTQLNLVQAFADVKSSYIADGHHRAAAASSVGVEKSMHNLRHTGEESYNYFNSVYFADDQLKIYEFNRLVRDLNGLSTEAFIEKLKVHFDVEPNGNTPLRPDGMHKFSMYLDGRWYHLTAKESIAHSDDPVMRLDVSILHHFVLKPILGIADPRTDSRITVLGGKEGLEKLQNEVDSGTMKVAFCLFPTTMKQLMEVADSGSVMPPKSTWFEPKIHCGLITHVF